jgi:hypothetical protein
VSRSGDADPALGLASPSGTRTAAIVAAAGSGVIFIAALANGFFPEMLASGLVICSIGKELRAPEPQQAAPGRGTLTAGGQRD